MDMSQPPMDTTKTAHVLAVDDDPSVRQMIADYLGDNEVRVTAVASGQEIAEVMARETIDLVVLDLRLPGEDGMQIARRLREESDVPIIMLTGRKDEADRVMGLELGADDYLTKPFSPRELLARIRALAPPLTRAARRSADGLAEDPRLPVRRLGAERAVAPPHHAGRRERALDEQRVQPARRVPLRRRSACCRATSCSACRACITTRSTTARSTCRSDGCAGSSSRARTLRQLIRTERGAGYVFTAPVEVVR